LPATVVPGQNEGPSWDVEKATNDIKSMKIKARSAKHSKKLLKRHKRPLMSAMVWLL